MVGLKQGRIFDQAPHDEVCDFLRARRVESVTLPPDKLLITNDGRTLAVQTFGNGAVKEYPLRASFFQKLLKWFAIPLRAIDRLNIDTVTSLLNDLLLSIHSGDVTLKVEDSEALTLTSRRYSEILDLDILKLCSPAGVATVSRNDFFLRVYSDIRLKTDPVPGDTCGFGYNVLNSETGFQALSVSHYMIRYICTNGAVMRLRGEGEQKRIHYGYRKDELHGFVKSRMAACDASRQFLIGRLKDSTRESCSKEGIVPLRRVNSILRHEGREVIKVGKDARPSIYELFNLITSQARSLDLIPRLQLEEIAGKMILPPALDWPETVAETK
jgi:hypothetical protein